MLLVFEFFMIKAVIFDVGGVVLHVNRDMFFEQISELNGLPVPMLRSLFFDTHHLERVCETGLVNSEEFFEKLKEIYNVQISESEMTKLYTGAVFTPIHSTFELIKRLKQRFIIGMLSDTGEWDFEQVFKNIEIFPLFDEIILSYKVKSMKPDSRIFEQALLQLGLKAEECVYVDNVKEYSDKSTQLGFKGVHYTGHESLISGLKAVGISVN